MAQAPEEVGESQPPRGHVRVVYLGPVAPHWDVQGVSEVRGLVDEFRARVLARLLLLPPHDPQFRRNRERVARDAEMRNFETNRVWGLSEITASDQARFMFDIEDTIPERHEHYALNLLTKIVKSQRWGIPPARPRGWEIHFKGGWSPEAGGPDWRVNQVALLRNEGRFSLAVLTKGDPSFDSGKATITSIERSRSFRSVGSSSLAM